MRSPRMRFLAAAAAPLVFLAACGGSEGDDSTTDDASATSSPEVAPSEANGDLADLGVDTENDLPSLTWNGEPFADGDLPFVATESESEVLVEGDGEEVAETDEVQVRYLLVGGTSGDEVISTFESDESVTLELDSEGTFPAFLEALPGSSAGDEMLIVTPAAEAFGDQGNEQLGVGPGETLIFYLEVLSSNEPLTQAQGEEVEPEEGLPTVEADGETAAQIDVEGVESPDQLISQVLIQGEGPEVAAGQTLRAHYTGVTLSEGEQFDTSYDRGEPADFPIGVGSVITGWDEGLVGQNVGSRVLLVIPADQAYGDDPEGHELGGEDLVFVVDILGAY